MGYGPMLYFILRILSKGLLVFNISVCWFLVLYIYVLFLYDDFFLIEEINRKNE